MIRKAGRAIAYCARAVLSGFVSAVLYGGAFALFLGAAVWKLEDAAKDRARVYLFLFFCCSFFLSFFFSFVASFCLTCLVSILPSR